MDIFYKIKIKKVMKRTINTILFIIFTINLYSQGIIGGSRQDWQDIRSIINSNFDSTGIVIGKNNISQPLYSAAIGGENNIIDSNAVKARYGTHSVTFGKDNYISSRYGLVSGIASWNDGLISEATGNANIQQANDSWAGGNQLNCGGKYYPTPILGADNAHGIDATVYPYIIIPDTITYGTRDYYIGDVTFFFQDSVSNAATGGDYYPSGITYPSGLSFAAHSFMKLRGGEEVEIAERRIFSTNYTAGVGTKIWYNNFGSTDQVFDTIRYVLGTYSPLSAYGGGNGLFTSGLRSSSFGYGADAGGTEGRAYGNGTFARGHFAIADTNYSTALGYFPKARGLASFCSNWETYVSKSGSYGTALNYKTNVIGSAGLATGNETTASQNASSFGDSTQALGKNSSSFGDRTISNSVGSFSIGKESKGYKDYQFTLSSGKIETIGDAQTSMQNVADEFADAGWWPFEIIRFKPKTSYSGKIILTGRDVDSLNEATAYHYEYTCTLGDSIFLGTSAINTSTDYIYVGKNISNDTRVLFSKESGSTIPSPIAIQTNYYVVNTKTDSIQISTSQGGATLDITTVGAGNFDVTLFELLYSTTDVDAIRGRNFSDGGNGTTTGIRTNIQTNYFTNKALIIRIDQIAGRTIRWNASHIFSEIANE
jgi:hypothetical protein